MSVLPVEIVDKNGSLVEVRELPDPRISFVEKFGATGNYVARLPEEPAWKRWAPFAWGIVSFVLGGAAVVMIIHSNPRVVVEWWQHGEDRFRVVKRVSRLTDKTIHIERTRTFPDGSRITQRGKWGGAGFVGKVVLIEPGRAPVTTSSDAPVIKEFNDGLTGKKKKRRIRVRKRR